MRSCPLRPVLTALSLGTLLFAACGPADSARRDLLAYLADEVIEPRQAELAQAAVTLAGATRSLCSSGEPGPARTAWLALRAHWGVTAAFAFGPVIDQAQAGPLDYWPVRSDTIEAAITGAPAAIDGAYIDGLGTSAKGMPALEYLLFAPPTPTGPRCDYAVALADDIERRCAEIAAAWHDEHAEALRNAGHGSAVYPSEQAGLDAVVNATIENLYRVVKTKLDRPLGNLTGSDPDGSLVESRFSDNGHNDIAANLDGFERAYVHEGLASLVAAKNPDLDQRIVDQLATARIALTAVPRSLQDAVVDQRGAVQTLRDEVDALRRLIKLDVASLLGVTLSLSDNDGD
ncbi:imelysin family protein [Nannocystis sp.]|uniref:imelysin family protein n=1 Tax=Nannocystis sp. TaxID=1962667 RepID=UPI00242597C3|nr:imelysin family protein [Nannocystis sp.]MBK7824131.1 imelysin family protein [Nannocystis sp.]MBK9755143.1 imelysin family protein [Nannocystis sp.]